MSNEQRDELAKVIETYDITSLEAEMLAECLIDEGWTKPRQVTTAEELDALPAKSAIVDNEGTPWVGDGDKVEPWASVCEDPFGGPIWKNSVDIALPATVLYEGASND